MGTDRRPRRQHFGMLAWLILILFALTTKPPAPPYGVVGSDEQREPQPCLKCPSRCTQQSSGLWVCLRNRNHSFTSKQLGLG